MVKPSWQWTENDLLKMKRNKTEESSNLEFKGAQSLGIEENKKNEISKDVSAFANSEGGILFTESPRLETHLQDSVTLTAELMHH